MKRNQILSVIKSLAQSQGFYGRLYSRLLDLAENEPDSYEDVMEVLEGRNFADPIDLVLFLES